jgi:hypothetical protein
VARWLGAAEKKAVFVSAVAAGKADRRLLCRLTR